MFPTHKLETDWIAVFQGDGAFKEVMIWFSYLGSEAFTYVLPFVYFCLCRKDGARLYLLFSFSSSLLHVLKLAFHLPRPVWIDPRIKALSVPGGYGMPSGHVLSASIVWPSVARVLDKSWAWLIAFTLVLLVSVSRVYLGVHFVSDVVAALCIAYGLHCCFAWMERELSKWFNSLSHWWQMAIALWAALIFLVIGLGVKSAIDGIVDPPLWSMYSASARGLNGFFRSVGEFFGAACGIIMGGRWACFEASGALWKRGAALGYALVGAWLIRELAKVMPFPHTKLLQSSFNFLPGAISNWWMLFVAPWILLKIGLLHTPSRILS